MIGDICYYDFSYLNTCKSKWIKNIVLYVVYLIMFVVANIIFYFIENDILYGVLISFVWFLFLNFSLIFIRNNIIKYKKHYKFYNLLYFGKKHRKILKFVKDTDLVILENDLEFNSYVFLDTDGNEIELYIQKSLNKKFEIDKTYYLSTVSNFIYGGDLHD